MDCRLPRIRPWQGPHRRQGCPRPAGIHRPQFPWRGCISPSFRHAVQENPRWRRQVKAGRGGRTPVGARISAGCQPGGSAGDRCRAPVHGGEGPARQFGSPARGRGGCRRGRPGRCDAHPRGRPVHSERPAAGDGRRDHDGRRRFEEQLSQGRQAGRQCPGADRFSPGR